MSALLWLLLPVAAASGWWLALRSQGRRQHCPPPELNEHYFKGLNFLLNEQPDKAIEVFVDIAKSTATRSRPTWPWATCSAAAARSIAPSASTRT
ncbi:hypothetical protein [Thiohalobacter thiocyanaticus]|uniref:hypothetical protein n=1 Tax=Thiohalobacter thiocyanaticus TaxID=585455 RepID=UPI001F4D4CBE|nr:hypothetical protein [Thiohalobacter thiocyanaticus]